MLAEPKHPDIVHRGMGNMVFFFALLIVILILIDWYVYKHWKSFARTNKRFVWTLPVYFFMMCIMPALQGLQAPLGVYGCLGNHDHYANATAIAGRLKSTPVDLLVNEHRTLQIDGAQLHLVGTDNTGFNQNYADLPSALLGIEETM